MQRALSLNKTINCCLAVCTSPLPPAFMRGVPQCAHWGGGSKIAGIAELPQSEIKDF